MAGMVRGRRVALLCIPGSVTVGDVDNGDMVGIEVNGGGEADDLTGCMGAKFGRINAIVDTGMQRVFGDLEHIGDSIGVKARVLLIILVDIIIPTDGGRDIAVQFVAAQMVEDFSFAAVLQDRPREKVVDGMADEVSACQQFGAAGAWFGKELATVVEDSRRG